MTLNNVIDTEVATLYVKSTLAYSDNGMFSINC